MVQFRAEWAIWKPYDDKGLGNGDYPTYPNGPSNFPVKIVLFARRLTEPLATDANQPHFSINLEPEGKAWQHVDMYKPAYALASGKDLTQKTVDPDKDGGRVVSICILCGNPGLWDPKYAGYDAKNWWTDARTARLAWYIGWLFKMDFDPTNSQPGNGMVEQKAPYSFIVNTATPDERRLSFVQWMSAGGVLSMMHAPFNTGRWDVGNLNVNGMIQIAKHWASLTPPPSSTAPGTPAAGAIDAVEQEQARAAGADAHVVQETSMEGKAFKFNPPLHNHNIPHRVDFVTGDPRNIPNIKTYYQNEPGEFPLGGEGVTALTKLRLGRLIQFEMAGGLAALNPYRYGFRFLYNPTAITVTANRNDSVYINPSSATDAIISGINQNFQVVTFKLLLNRQVDVLAIPVKVTDYIPNITQEDRDGLRKFGTHWDLQYLYRMSNGEWDLEDQGKTSDIGFLVPASARLILGQMNLYGFVEGVSYTDLMFSKNMVPTMTEVELTFRRNVDIQDVAAFDTLLGATDPAASTTTSDGTGGGSSSAPSSANSPPPTGRLTGAQVEAFAKGAGFNASDAHLMTQIAWAESTWTPKIKNYIPCYGLWQINMSSKLAPGRLKEYGISNAESLYDPATNAFAARKLFLSQGLTAWTAYTNGHYKNAPTW